LRDIHIRLQYRETRYRRKSTILSSHEKTPVTSSLPVQGTAGAFFHSWSRGLQTPATGTSWLFFRTIIASSFSLHYPIRLLFWESWKGGKG
jgi:hypothetical protein